ARRSRPSWWAACACGEPPGLSGPRIDDCTPLSGELRQGMRRTLALIRSDPPLSHRLRRERHVREHLRNVRIVVPVAIPRPAGARVEHFAIASQLLKARTIDAP